MPPESAFSVDSSCDLGYFDESQWADRKPERLLAFFVGIMFLVWFDNGLFASNGVTGCSKDCDDSVGYPTTQVTSLEWLATISAPRLHVA